MKIEYFTHVIRNGGWLSGVEYCRVASRNYSPPDYRHYSYGFRI